MAEGFTNFANTTLNTSIISTDLSIVLVDGSTFPTANFFIVIDWNLASHEIIYVTSRSTNTLTVVSTADRGLDGTTAASHTSGAKVIHGWLARHATQIFSIGPAMAMGY